MILNTKNLSQGNVISSLEILVAAGFPVHTSGASTKVIIRPTSEATRTSWGEIIHFRHYPAGELTVYVDSNEAAIEVLADEFHLWEVRESRRFHNQRQRQRK